MGRKHLITCGRTGLTREQHGVILEGRSRWVASARRGGHGDEETGRHHRGLRQRDWAPGVPEGAGFGESISSLVAADANVPTHFLNGGAPWAGQGGGDNLVQEFLIWA